MSLAHALTTPYDRTPGAGPSRPDSVKARLTPKRPRRPVENDEYAAFARRILRAYSRRIAQGDIDALADMADLAAEIDTATGQAVTGLRAAGLLLGRHRRYGSASPARLPSNAGGIWHDHHGIGRRSHPRTIRLGGGGACRRAHRNHHLGRLPHLGTAARLVGHLLPPHPPARPHRSHRQTTGEIAPVYDTASEPGGVLHVACGNRRESVCPACSQVYKRDARQLVRAGLAGGKGVPETITTHPCVFATLTAPSFGPVHSRRMRGKTVLPCRPRRDAKARRCPHGRDISCPTRHVEDDPRLGRPMCGDCYDYQAAVLFNACAGDLWRRFTTYLPRQLARLTGVSLEDLVRGGRNPLRQGR